MTAQFTVDEPDALDDGVLTLSEAATVLRISVSTAKKLAKRGDLPGILPKLGTQWRVSKRLLAEYMNTPAKDTHRAGHEGE